MPVFVKRPSLAAAVGRWLATNGHQVRRQDYKIMILLENKKGDRQIAL
jgi:hypothetical protein